MDELEISEVKQMVETWVKEYDEDHDDKINFKQWFTAA